MTISAEASFTLSWTKICEEKGKWFISKIKSQYRNKVKFGIYLDWPNEPSLLKAAQKKQFMSKSKSQYSKKSTLAFILTVPVIWWRLPRRLPRRLWDIYFFMNWGYKCRRIFLLWLITKFYRDQYNLFLYFTFWASSYNLSFFWPSMILQFIIFVEFFSWLSMGPNKSYLCSKELFIKDVGNGEGLKELLNFH